ncbi:ROK family protein [Cryptosporangium aurantiacum]|uniref:Glucokinase n=1 Tax=Cryptosporangium aurantiacum TaxID=134849 RepID=A0A1M7QG60_9ACTN|nr:ROK family protein [Cryptosporangium aurantiacum]SHN29652.1 glucokinase [Cryptosporangium aurantiacum]
MTVNSAPTVVTLDIGGTTIKGALVASDGREITLLERPTGAAEGTDEVVRRVRAAARDLADAGTVGIGLSVPGIVDTAAGVARHAVNLGFRDTPLAALVAEEVGLPVVLEQDCRAAALAESEIGLGRDARDLMVVVLGTGVAAGLIVDGKVLPGAGGSAGELGHLPVYPDGEDCACGQRGCLEVYASASGIARRYAAAGGSFAGATAANVAASLDSDVVAARVWREATEALGLALATATLLLDPALIVLAGGLTGAGDTLLRPVRTELQGALAWRAAPSVANSPLGGTAGRLGAAILAWRAAGYTDVVSRELRDAV